MATSPGRSYGEECRPEEESRVSTERAFLDALLAAPAENDTRLVYADWLEENGDCTRAEFLRLVARPDAAGSVTKVRERLGQISVGLDIAWLAPALGLRVAAVEVALRLAVGATASFRDGLEVSLDCCVCRRCYRTVLFTPDGQDGKCTPTGHAFPGYLLGKWEEVTAQASSCRYLVAYRYEAFVDAKYSDWRRPQGVPTWGRVYFVISCPTCRERGTYGTQTNMVRPHICHCRCGTALYEEDREMPALSWSDGRAS
jgi:uncharacterized protein (TIGR02996 family)